jgi:Uma2 family endonuclease
MLQAPPRTILEVFESLPEGTLAQIINNNLIIAPSPDFQHQDIVSEVASQLRMFVNKSSLGKVIVAPMDVYFGWKNVYQPDILFLSNDRMNLVQDGKIKGAPDLIIEVLSPGTEAYDKKEKKEIYEQFGVKEYWLVDPGSKKTTGYLLKDGFYVETPSKNGAIISILLKITIQF